MDIVKELDRELPDRRVELVAHTPGEKLPDLWHGLADHLKGTAELGARFAAPFGGCSVVYFAGLTHDVGKARAKVQQRLRERGKDKSGKPLGEPHKLEGSALAWLLFDDRLREASVVGSINYGHHRGMVNWTPDLLKIKRTVTKNGKSLEDLIELVEFKLGLSLSELVGGVQLPGYLIEDKAEDLELFIRMCHSALVDADFLDTEAHFSAFDGPRQSHVLGMRALRDTFMAEYAQRFADAPDTPINLVRRDYFERCLKAATLAQSDGRPIAGIFRLPAPTGCAKTMAAAAFGLHHAAAFGKRRVIVAVPYTTITTQNAAEYRSMFAALGEDVVLEHHSNIVDDEVADQSWRRLAAENWDAEFIVTTTVQLFESLFSNRPSKTRKLHRIANSVIVLDEVQSIPLDLLQSTLHMLRQLTQNYGVTVLLASATQPTFSELKVWQDLAVYDIADVHKVPEVTRRVQFEVRDQPQSWEAISEELAERRSVLTIVNTTADAQCLHRLVVERDQQVPTFHLSKRMCAAHRQTTLDEVKRLLDAHQPVRLVTTQLIEAGVDIDFPVVYRALAPAESVVQSAGRCNREGLLGQGGGEVVAFIPADGKTPPGQYRNSSCETRSRYIDGFGGEVLDFGEAECLSKYYRAVYASQLDSSLTTKSTKIEDHRRRLAFEDTARSYRLIDDGDVVPVVVTTYGPQTDRAKIADLLDLLRSDQNVKLLREQWRLLQRYTCDMRRTSNRKPPPGAEAVVEGIWRWGGRYDDRLGIIPLADDTEAVVW